jgi:hypothetical protein
MFRNWISGYAMNESDRALESWICRRSSRKALGSTRSYCACVIVYRRNRLLRQSSGQRRSHMYRRPSVDSVALSVFAFDTGIE